MQGLPLRAELVALLGARAEVFAAMNRFFCRAIEKRLRRRARARGVKGGKGGAVTFFLRFSSTLRVLNEAASRRSEAVRADESLLESESVARDR